MPICLTSPKLGPDVEFLAGNSRSPLLRGQPRQELTPAQRGKGGTDGRQCHPRSWFVRLCPAPWRPPSPDVGGLRCPVTDPQPSWRDISGPPPLRPGTGQRRRVWAEGRLSHSHRPKVLAPVAGDTPCNPFVPGSPRQRVQQSSFGQLGTTGGAPPPLLKIGPNFLSGQSKFFL